MRDKHTIHFTLHSFIVLFSRYAAEYDEFGELEKSCTAFGIEPSLNITMKNTFPDNFSDVNSEDMRRPLPEWMNQMQMEEDFHHPSPDNYLWKRGL